MQQYNTLMMLYSQSVVYSDNQGIGSTNEFSTSIEKAGESLRRKPVEHMALVSGAFPDTKPSAVKQEEITFRYGSKW